MKNSSYKEIYSWNYPDFKTGGNFTNSNGTILSILKDSAPCSITSLNNYMVSIGSYSNNILGYSPKNSCSSGSPSVSIISKGANSQGCIANDQITTNIAYPCGSYGDVGATFEIYFK